MAGGDRFSTDLPEIPAFIRFPSLLGGDVGIDGAFRLRFCLFPLGEAFDSFWGTLPFGAGQNAG